MSYYRKGEARPVKTGRAARVRVGRFNSVARRRDVLARLVERVNAGRTTAAEYLTGIGADAEFIRRFASPFGREIAKQYRTKFGTEPVKAGLALVHRRLVRVFAYATDELPILDAAARTYARTAALVG